MVVIEGNSSTLASAQHRLVKSLFLCAVTCCLLLPMSLSAQDVFKGGESVRQYNYIEILRMEPDVVGASALFRFGLLKNVKNNLSVLFQYSSVQVDNPDFEIDVRGYNAGVQFHDNFKWLPDTDWIASIAAGRSVVTVKGVSGLDNSDNFVVTWLGLRGSLSDKLEGEVYARYYRESNGRSNEQLQAKLVYRAAHNIDAVIQLVDIPSEPEFGFAVRLVW